MEREDGAGDVKVAGTEERPGEIHRATSAGSRRGDRGRGTALIYPQCIRGIPPAEIFNKRLGVCGFGTRARGLGLPGVTQLDAAREDEGAGLIHAGVDTRALDGVAGSAAGHEIARIFLSLTGAGNDEIHTHDQGVLETPSRPQYWQR